MEREHVVRQQLVGLELVRLHVERKHLERQQLVGLELVREQLVRLHVERKQLVERLVDGGHLGLGGPAESDSTEP